MSFIDSCRVCTSPNLELVLDLGIQPWGNDYRPVNNKTPIRKYPLQVVQCLMCRTVQINYTIPRETMFQNHHYLSGTTKTLRDHFHKVSHEIIKYPELSSGDWIMDIGGNDGTFLSNFDQSKFNVLNIESSELQAKTAENAGVFTINAFFGGLITDRILNEIGKIKVIHASGILFHLENLHESIESISKLLHEDGMLVAEFIYLPKMIEKNAYDQIYHEHLLYYSMQTFSKLLNIYNLEVFKAVLDPIHGGSCIAYVGKRGSRLVDKSVERLFLYENEFGFNEHKKLLKFAKAAEIASAELRIKVNKLKRDKQRIFALGAPVKGSTLVNFAKLDVDLIEMSTERNPYKFNTFIPGTRIPVINENLAPTPDYYLLLAWNFKEEILNRYKNFTNSGGKFIEPIPSPKVL